MRTWGKGLVIESMGTKSTFLVDAVIVVFAVTVALIYFGGYYYPQPVGNWTDLGMLVYLLMLVFAALYTTSEFFKRSKTNDQAAHETKKRSKRT